MNDTLYLDATAPLLQPHDLGRRLPDLRRGGIDAALTTAASIEEFTDAMTVIGQWLEIERSRRHPVRIGRSVAALRAAKAEGDIGIVLHFQGADPIGDQLDRLNLFHASGLRVMQLTYNARNRLGDGCFEESDAGLSKFGRAALARMEALGIAVDLSHAGQRTALQVTEAATRPLVVTHANARALFDTPRNLPDDLIRQVAASGGVIGVCAAPFFLTRGRPATRDMLIDHIAYIAALVGVAHVGVGFDFAEEDADDYVYYGYDERYIPKPPWIWPSGIAGHAEAGGMAAALLAHGFDDGEITDILGENFLRVFARLWGG